MTRRDPHRPVAGDGPAGPDDIFAEALFETARAQAPDLPEALQARILADAQAVQPAPRGSGVLAGWMQRWQQWGGLPALGGMVSATVVGFWLGVAPPEGLPDYAGQLVGTAQDTAFLTEDEASVDMFGADLFDAELFDEAYDLEPGADPEEG